MKRSIYLSVIVFGISAAVEAAPVTIEYVGHVIRHDEYPDAPGYEIGDSVRGVFLVNKEKARAEYIDHNRSNLSAWDEEYGLVSGPLAREEGFALDSAVVWNNSYPSLTNNGDDFLSVTDGVVFSEPYVSEFFTFTLNVYLGHTDWLHDLDIENVELEVTDPLIIADSLGLISHMYVIEGDTQNYTISYNTLFRLDYLRIASVKVPEPISLGLYLIGLLSVLMRRACH